jgi:beta-lactamase class D
MHPFSLIKSLSVSVVLLHAGVIFSCIKGGKKPMVDGIAVEDSTVLRTDFQQYFKACKVDGSIVLYDAGRKRWLLSDTTGTRLETLPASTFKIMNLLILLETKAIKDENEIVKWPGFTDTAKYGYRPDIYHDMSVKEAFQRSAGWVFVELANRAGREAYKKYLAASSYGNMDLSQTDPDFWNFGGFAISAINQVAFLEKLQKGDLPFSRRNMEIVKRVMITEEAPGYILRAKTGWTRDKGMNTGWWIGYVENAQGVYFFATRLLQDRTRSTASFGECRRSITRKVLKDLGITR